MECQSADGVVDYQITRLPDYQIIIPGYQDYSGKPGKPASAESSQLRFPAYIVVVEDGKKFGG